MMARMTRYSLYYRLIDFATLCQVVMLGRIIHKQVTGISLGDSILVLPIKTAIIIGLFLPPLLIFQKWMRDDFSEAIWQKTAGTVLKALVVLPIPIMFIVIVSIVVRVGMGMDPAERYMSTSDFGLPPVLQGQMAGVMQSMLTLWITASTLFTLAFQWHRWRASR